MALELLMVRGRRFSSEQDETEILESFSGGTDWIRVAAEMWRLVDANKADAIEEVLARVNRRPSDDPELRFEGEDVADLVELLGGLADAFVATVVGKDLLVPPERAADIAARLPRLADGRPTGVYTHLVSEGIHNVEAVRSFLRRALNAGCDVIVS